MIIQSTLALFSTATGARSSSARQTPIVSSENAADTVRISSAAREAFPATASTTNVNKVKSVEVRLAEIRANGAVNRSQEDQDYLFAKDKRLAEITAQGKQDEKLTADELDYVQKATGLVNTFANLSSAEKMLYDKAVASGNVEAAAGIAQIALVRMGGHMADGASGTTYDPLNAEISTVNIAKYFNHSIIDPTGEAQSKFQALIQFLQNNSAA